jgi:hypothetical protein
MAVAILKYREYAHTLARQLIHFQFMCHSKNPNNSKNTGYTQKQYKSPSYMSEYKQQEAQLHPVSPYRKRFQTQSDSLFTAGVFTEKK